MNNSKTKHAKLIRRKRSAYVTARRNLERLTTSLVAIANVASDLGQIHQTDRIADFETSLRSGIRSEVNSLREIIDDFATLPEHLDPE